MANQFTGQMQVTYPLIGFNSYNYNGKTGLFLHCVESYPADSQESGGSFQTAISAPYSELKKLFDMRGEKIPASLEAPATITFKGALQNRGGNTVLLCEEIISVVPQARPSAGATTTKEPKAG